VAWLGLAGLGWARGCFLGLENVEATDQMEMLARMMMMMMMMMICCERRRGTCHNNSTARRSRPVGDLSLTALLSFCT
jgi:hypothetical protein